MSIKKRLLNSGHPRSIQVRKQILYSFGLKGISILVNLAYVPLLVDYLGAEEYGIWLTLTSIVSWFTFFDIGLGNGLRNNFTKAITEGKHELARTYVSTTYAILSIIFGTLLIVFNIVAPFLNWQSIFNTPSTNAHELLLVAIFVFSFFFLRFVFQLIGVILMADQKPSINNSFNVLGNVISLAIIYFCKNTMESSLPVLGLVISGVPVIILIMATWYFYKTSYYKYAPSLKYVDFSKSGTLLNLGVKFFILQISGVVMYSSTNMLIAQFSTPTDVTLYNISYKMFAVFTMVYGIILTPMWSATTEAFELKDYSWIKNFVIKMQKLGFGLVVFIVLALFYSNEIYSLWVGNRITISSTVSLLVALNAIIFVLTGVYVSFQNGVGKLKLTLRWVVLQTILYFPFAYLFSEILNFGFIGILVAGIIMELPVKYIQVRQYYKIINGKANGIWLK